jgi:uncharacterized protein
MSDFLIKIRDKYLSFLGFSPELLDLKNEGRQESISSIFKSIQAEIKKTVKAFSEGGVFKISERKVVFLEHRHLIKMVNLIYPESCKGGVCNGVALLGIQCFFAGNEEIVNRHLARLNQLYKEKGSYEAVIEHLQSSNDVEVLSFLEVVHFCMEGYKYKGVMDPESGPKHQTDTNFASTVLSITAIEGQIPIETSGEIKVGVFTQESLENYFEKIEAANNSVGLYMASGYDPHAISVGYDSEKKEWVFIDINNGRIERVQSKKELAQKIIYAYQVEVSNDSLAIGLLGMRNSDISDFEILIEPPFSENLTKEQSERALLLASRIGDIKTVSKIIESNKDIDINIRNARGYSPLLSAVTNGHDKLAHLLIQKGADINSTDELYKMSALHFAIEEKNESLALYLIGLENINLKLKDDRGFDALYLAQAFGLREVVDAISKRENEMMSNISNTLDSFNLGLVCSIDEVYKSTVRKK